MRAVHLFVACSLLPLALVAGCEDKPPPTPASQDAGPKKAPSPKKRPPFPNMATAAWGSTVMERLEKEHKAADGTKATEAVAASLAALHELAPDAPERVVRAAVHAHQAAETDGDRALGAALAAVGLVLDEKLDGYKERLTDAHGLAAYAGTLKGGTAVAQAARAFVAVAAGRIKDGEKLVDVMAGAAEKMDPDTALLVGHARWYLGQRNDDLFAMLDKAVDGRPDSARARGLLAYAYLQLGLADLAVAVVDRAPEKGDALHPWLRVLKGRALALADQPWEADLEAGVEQLRGTRAGVAHYLRGRSYLARSVSEVPTEVLASLDQLEAQPAFVHEASVLAARVAQHKGDYAKARGLAEKTCKARGVRPALAIDCLWALTEACAGLGDVRCVAKEGEKAVGSDGNRARMMHARAALSLVGKKPAKTDAPSDPNAVDVAGALKQAHLLDPFSAELAKTTGLPLAQGGPPRAQLVRGARRALALGAPKAADRALAAVEKAKDCRVCRALAALAARDADEGARRAAAALTGKGPALALADLIAVIDVLGGSTLDAAQKALIALGKDTRPEVKAAVAQATKEQQNPDARAARKAEEQKAPEQPGTVPAPTGNPHRGH